LTRGLSPEGAKRPEGLFFVMDKRNFSKLDKKLPDLPGVYSFKSGRKILYIGKATSLKDRIKSYFFSDIMSTRGALIVKMIEEADAVTFKKTDSVLEAIIIEANYIKKFQPRYNSREKDDKSYNYIVITKEDFPRILLMRGRELNLKATSYKLKTVFGPFPHGGQLKEALKIVRKMFPFRDRCVPKITARNSRLKASRPCFNRQIGLCPGVCTGEISKQEYARIVRNIELFFSGKKERILKNLEKEMEVLVKSQEFEEANKTKKQIFALRHIQDVSLLKSQVPSSKLQASYRLEAYDVAHIGGKETVGAMVVIENGEPAKRYYRKFKIRGGKDGVRIDDIANLKEILERRFAHKEWAFPDLIVVDGGIAQKNLTEHILNKRKLNTQVISVVKGENHKPKKFLGDEEITKKYKNEILLANSEAHRFAIKYHREKRDKFERR